MNEISKRTIQTYKNYLIEEEKCSVTIEKYIRDITAFVNWTDGKEITKTLVLEYKSMLTQQYAPASVNSVLSSLNGYFNYIERYDLKVKNLKVQRQIFCQSEKGADAKVKNHIISIMLVTKTAEIKKSPSQVIAVTTNSKEPQTNES